MRKLIVALVVMVVVLLAADFGTRAFAQAQFASELRQTGFSARPSVSVAGFPFLTQVASGDIRRVVIDAPDVPAGPVTITRFEVVLTEVRPNSSFTGATVGHLSGSAFISFAELSRALTTQAGGLAGALAGSGLTLTPAGPDEVRASLNLLVATASATWRLSMRGGDVLHAQLVSSSGLPASLLGPAKSVSVPLTALPLGLRISGITVGPRGITGNLTGTALTFGQ